ncbi:MAG: conjugal transfer protein TraD [Bacillota bacterium]
MRAKKTEETTPEYLISEAAKLREKAAEFEKKAALLSRKHRTRSLIEYGGLVVKSGLDSLSKPLFMGCLLRIKQTLDEKPHLSEELEQIGSAELAKPKSKKTGEIDINKLIEEFDIDTLTKKVNE